MLFIEVFLFCYIIKLRRQRKELKLTLALKNHHLDATVEEIQSFALKTAAYEKQINSLKSPTLFKLQSTSTDTQLVGFRCERDTIKAFDEKCFVDGIKISRAVMLRALLEDFLNSSKIHE